MTHQLKPDDLLLEHTEAEVQEACDGFVEACIAYRNSLGEEGENQTLQVWMHPDMFVWAGLVLQMGISTPDERIIFYGIELQKETLKGKGTLYQFHKP